MATQDDLESIFEAISDLLEDSSVPKNVKTKLESVSCLLKSEGDLSIKLNKALDELDELAEDTNLQPYTRTQIWNLVSVMESI